MKTLQSWTWRGLTLCGRILIIKTFPIPKVLYCKSLVSTNNDFKKRLTKYCIVLFGKAEIK